MCVCLVEEYDPSDPHMAYAALSYVWGQKQKLMLSAQMEPALRKPGSISDEIIPKTISDAISVARSLSLPFLWVDAICIMQGTTHDDTADKKEQIGNSEFIILYNAIDNQTIQGFVGRINICILWFSGEHLQIGVHHHCCRSW